MHGVFNPTCCSFFAQDNEQIEVKNYIGVIAFFIHVAITRHIHRITTSASHFICSIRRSKGIRMQCKQAILVKHPTHSSALVSRLPLFQQHHNLLSCILDNSVHFDIVLVIPKGIL